MREPKFKLGQRVFFMQHNLIWEAIVATITIRLLPLRNGNVEDSVTYTFMYDAYDSGGFANPVREKGLESAKYELTEEDVYSSPEECCAYLAGRGLQALRIPENTENTFSIDEGRENNF